MSAKGKECNCGKNLKRRRKHGDDIDLDSVPVSAARTKVVATCPTCLSAMIGSNGNKYPLHLLPMDVPLGEVEKWIKDGFNIIIERPSY